MARLKSDWSDFVERIDAIHASTGRGYMVKAFHPNPEAMSIGDDVVTPIEVGPAGYLRPHGERVTF